MVLALALYPKRSIASHRFCGSGRLFPGLGAETQRVSMNELVVTEDRSNSEGARMLHQGPGVKREIQLQLKTTGGGRSAGRLVAAGYWWPLRFTGTSRSLVT